MSGEIDHESQVRDYLKKIHDEMVMSRTLQKDILDALGNIFQILDERLIPIEADGD